MTVRRIATTAAAATLTLLVLGGTAYALGTDDVPTVTAVPAASTTDTTAPTTTDSPPAGDTTIPVERARELAVAAVGGGEVTKVESELEHGRLEWKVAVSNDSGVHDVRIDATTGAVTSRSSTATSTATTTPTRPAPAPAPAPRVDDRGGLHDIGDDHGDDRVRTGDDGARHGGDDHGHSGRH